MPKCAHSILLALSSLARIIVVELLLNNQEVDAGFRHLVADSGEDIIFESIFGINPLKHEKAERLVRHHQISLEDPTAAALACNYMVDDDELDGDEEEEQQL
jgi:hypothetical protein